MKNCRPAWAVLETDDYDEACKELERGWSTRYMLDTKAGQA